MGMGQPAGLWAAEPVPAHAYGSACRLLLLLTGYCLGLQSQGAPWGVQHHTACVQGAAGCRVAVRTTSCPPGCTQAESGLA